MSSSHHKDCATHITSHIPVSAKGLDFVSTFWGLQGLYSKITAVSALCYGLLGYSPTDIVGPVSDSMLTAGVSVKYLDSKTGPRCFIFGWCIWLSTDI